MSKQVTIWGAVFTVLALLIGAVAGNFVSDASNAIALDKKDTSITALTEELDTLKSTAPVVITNITEVEIPSAEALLENAKKDAWNELSDDDEFLVCSGVEYDQEEVTLSRITDWSYTWIDKDESKVAFVGKYKFDSTDDDDRCTSTRNVYVYYEDGEKPSVKWF